MNLKLNNLTEEQELMLQDWNVDMDYFISFPVEESNIVNHTIKIYGSNNELGESIEYSSVYRKSLKEDESQATMFQPTTYPFDNMNMKVFYHNTVNTFLQLIDVINKS